MFRQFTNAFLNIQSNFVFQGLSAVANGLWTVVSAGFNAVTQPDVEAVKKQATSTTVSLYSNLERAKQLELEQEKLAEQKKIAAKKQDLLMQERIAEQEQAFKLLMSERRSEEAKLKQEKIRLAEQQQALSAAKRNLENQKKEVEKLKSLKQVISTDVDLFRDLDKVKQHELEQAKLVAEQKLAEKQDLDVQAKALSGEINTLTAKQSLFTEKVKILSEQERRVEQQQAFEILMRERRSEEAKLRREIQEQRELEAIQELALEEAKAQELALEEAQRLVLEEEADQFEQEKARQRGLEEAAELLDDNEFNQEQDDLNLDFEVHVDDSNQEVSGEEQEEPSAPVVFTRQPRSGTPVIFTAASFRPVRQRNKPDFYGFSKNK